MTKLEREETIRTKYETLKAMMSELVRRRWAAVEAHAIGQGGISVVSRATKLSRNTISKGMEELYGTSGDVVTPLKQGYARHSGGGRKRLADIDSQLILDLQSLVDSDARGDPQSPLQWTCKSTRKLAEELKTRGHKVTERTVAGLLKQLHFSLQGTRKTEEGKSHPDRNAQFEYINSQVKDFQERGQPVVSVDAKKAELVGNYKNTGKEWHPEGKPSEVKVYDFKDKDLGKGIPYGIYDITQNRGWVSVGTDHNTAQFARSAICLWWQRMGSKDYPDAHELLITADGGGSNSSRSKLWKIALQQLSNCIGLRISVCHLPPGTSKWNKIEHRMFCHITENWRGRPLQTLEIIVNLIGHTTTKTGLNITAELDTNKYETGIKVSDEELAAVNIKKADFHGEWNYTISPTK
jgi:hypothetical protein